MFLFLSKLLPLFFYPVGVACWLLVLALMWWRRYPRRAVCAVLTALLTLTVASSGFTAKALVHSLESQYVSPTAGSQADAVVVLGGATRARLSPRPWVEVNEAGDRLLYGAKLYRDGQAPLVILSGGRVGWGSQSDIDSEAMDMATLMVDMGVPFESLVLETRSRNTYENAVNVAEILADRQIETVLLVTSAIHMPRAMRIFRHLEILAIAAPTDFLSPELDNINNWQRFWLVLLPNSLYLDLTSRVMKEYIGVGVYWLNGWLS